MSQPEGKLDRAADALRRVAEGTASATGEDFFPLLVRHLASALEHRYCFVARCLGSPPVRVRTLAFWNGNGMVENFEYALEGTPCEQVMRDQERVFRSGVQQEFPADQELVDLQVESYAGVPMHGAGGRVIGHLAVMDVNAFNEDGPDLSLLSLFAARAAAELERQQSMVELAASEQKFSALFQESNDAIFLHDLEGNILDVNRRATELIAASRQQLLGCNLFDFFTPDALPRAQESCQRLQADGKVFCSSTFQRRDGRSCPVEISASLVPIAGQTLVQSLVREISERLDAERSLRVSEERLRQVINLVPHFIFAKDRQGRFILVNQAVAEAYGTTVEDLLGRTDSDFAFSVEEVEQFRRDDLEVIESGTMKVVEEEPITDVHGNVRILQTVKIPFTFANSDLPSVLGVSTDITERKRNEHLLRQTAEELRSLVSAISHDLRAPLVNLNGFSAELRQLLDGCQPVIEQALPALPAEPREVLEVTFARRLPEALEMIQDSAGRIDDLTRALLRLSEVGRRRLAPAKVQVREVVDEVLHALRVPLQQTQTEVEVGPLPELVVDRMALEQVLHFLLTNALAYLQPGRAGRIEIAGQRNRSTTVLHVRDNGRGIAADDLAKVFLPFRRLGSLETAGEGMGLAYARALVRRLSGDIWCESAPGVGTVFWVSVPNRPLSS